MLPGPVIKSVPAQPSNPYANPAIAWAPPIAYTSSTPSSAQTASTVGCGKPPYSFCGGDATASDSTPATWAGTTFMTTLDASGARPPGTYSPTRPTGTSRCVTRPPGAGVDTTSVPRSSSLTARTRRIDSSNASFTA